MKKHTILLAILVLGLTLFAQEIQQQAVSINIEVPVRVYKGDSFVNDLTINDFEVYEDGILQDVEAVYLINKMNIQSKEEKQIFLPQTSRSFYLVFEVVEYTPKLNEAIDYFFQNVLDPQDNLTIMTPKKTYRFKSEHLKTVSREQIINQLRGILRKDAWSASSEYRNLSDELIKVIESINIIVRAVENNSGRLRRLSRPSTGGGNPRGISSTLDEAIEEDPMVDLGRYEELMQRMENIRNIDQKRLLDFANILKDQEGQKYVFLFYQREFIPQLSTRALIEISKKNDPLTSMKVASQMGYYFRDVAVDLETIKKVYSDSSVSINFLFFTKPAEYIPGIQMVEHSEDIFGIFSEMAQATGGIMSSSSNPKYLFERASDAVESYYLLYYSPKNYVASGKFKKINVKIKGKNYRITHRAGYIAD